MPDHGGSKKKVSRSNSRSYKSKPKRGASQSSVQTAMPSIPVDCLCPLDRLPMFNPVRVSHNGIVMGVFEKDPVKRYIEQYGRLPNQQGTPDKAQFQFTVAHDILLKIRLYFRQNYVDTNPELVTAMIQKNRQGMRVAIAKGGMLDPAAYSDPQTGMTLFHYVMSVDNATLFYFLQALLPTPSEQKKAIVKQDKQKRTPLFYALKNKQVDSKLVGTLFGLGERCSQYAYLAAAFSADREAILRLLILRQQVDIAKCLVPKDLDKRSLLHVKAAEHQWTSIINLLKFNADPLQSDKGSNSALHYLFFAEAGTIQRSSWQRAQEVLKVMLEKARIQDINTVMNAAKETPVHALSRVLNLTKTTAAQQSLFDCLELLVKDYKGNVHDTRNQDGRSPLDLIQDASLKKRVSDKVHAWGAELLQKEKPQKGVRTIAREERSHAFDDMMLDIAEDSLGEDMSSSGSPTSVSSTALQQSPPQGEYALFTPALRAKEGLPLPRRDSRHVVREYASVPSLGPNQSPPQMPTLLSGAAPTQLPQPANGQSSLGKVDEYGRFSLDDKPQKGSLLPRRSSGDIPSEYAGVSSLEQSQPSKTPLLFPPEVLQQLPQPQSTRRSSVTDSQYGRFEVYARPKMGAPLPHRNSGDIQREYGPVPAGQNGQSISTQLRRTGSFSAQQSTSFNAPPIRRVGSSDGVVGPKIAVRPLAELLQSSSESSRDSGRRMRPVSLHMPQKPVVAPQQQQGESGIMVLLPPVQKKPAQEPQPALDMKVIETITKLTDVYTTSMKRFLGQFAENCRNTTILNAQIGQLQGWMKQMEGLVEQAQYVNSAVRTQFFPPAPKGGSQNGMVTPPGYTTPGTVSPIGGSGR